MVGVVCRAEQALLFAGEVEEQDAALLVGLFGEVAGQFHDAGGAAGVIVGAGVYGAGLAGRERVLSAQPQVIVVRADDDVFIGLAGQEGSHVVHGLDGALDVEIGVHADGIGEGEGLGLEVLIDRGFNFLQALAGIGEPLFDAGFLHLHKRNAGIGGARGDAEFLQFIGLARMVGAVGDQDHAGRTVHFGIGCLGGELRVLGEGLAFEDALRVRFLGLVAHHQDDLAFDVETGVVVVAVFGRGNAVAGEDHRAGQRSGLRKIERDEVVGKAQGGGAAVLGELEAVGLAEGGVGGDRERLQVAIADGFDAQLPIVVFQERGGPFQLRTAGGAAAQFRRCEELDVVEVESGIDGRGRGESDGGKDEAGKEASSTDFHFGLLFGLYFFLASGRQDGRLALTASPGHRV